MEIDRRNVSGSLLGFRVLTPALEYYYDNHEERLKYARDRYHSKKDFINAKRRAAHNGDDNRRQRKNEADLAYYRKNRVKIALQRREKRRIEQALKAAERETLEQNKAKNGYLKLP